MKLYSVQEYANLCKVSRQVIYTRIRSGQITFKKVREVTVIDIDENPIKGAKSAGRPAIGNTLR